MLKKEVKFQKVQEKTYEEFIRAIAFRSVIKDGKEQMYPKVIVLENKEVQFLHESGNVISGRTLLANKSVTPGKYIGRRALLSRKGNFVAIWDYTGKSGNGNYIVEEEYTICNDRGEEIYRIEGPMEGAAQEDIFLISDRDGSAVGTRIAFGAIDFYRPDGSIKTVPLFGELGWGRREGYVTFSEDGEYLAALVREIAEPKGRQPSLEADLWVMLFDIRGNELWRRKVDEYRYGNMAISEHGEYQIFKAFSIERAASGKKGKILQRKGGADVLTSTALCLYDKEGHELSFKDTSLYVFDGFSFSPQADYAVLTGLHVIRLIRTKDGSTIFEKELSKDVAIRQSLFSSDGEYLIVRLKVPVGKEKITERTGGPREYRTVYGGRVIIFNMKGDQIWQNDFGELREIFFENMTLGLLFPHKYEIHNKN
jgi:hypothetical protein